MKKKVLTRTRKGPFFLDIGQQIVVTNMQNFLLYRKGLIRNLIEWCSCSSDQSWLYLSCGAGKNDAYPSKSACIQDGRKATRAERKAGTIRSSVGKGWDNKEFSRKRWDNKEFSRNGWNMNEGNRKGWVSK